MYKKEQLKLQSKVITANVRAFNLSMTQYNNGFVSYQRLLTTVEKLTRNEDAYASTKGDISVYVISLYKALGGGWEIGRDKSYLHVDDVEVMKARTDWGEYFDANSTNLPKAEL
jgi:outer membrane protein TolC